MSDLQQPPSSRTACNRCKAQKLRCIRIEGHPTFACIRCVKCQGVECVTSSTKRPGRPTRKSTIRQLPDSSPAPQKPSDVGESIVSLDAMDMMHPDFDEWFNLGMLDTNYALSWPSIDSGENSHALSIPNGGSSVFDMSSPSSRADEEMEVNYLAHQTPILESERHARSFDHELHVSGLHRELSKLLSMLESMPWDMTEVMRLTCVDGSRDGCIKETQANFGLNPLADIAKRSAEFAHLLRSFQNPSGNDYDDIADSTTPRPSRRPRLSVSDLLGTLSCHMLIVSIYDSIFNLYIDQCQQNPETFTTVMQSAPQIFLGGIAVPAKPHMLGQLLSCLTESQLRPIELLLGLPDEFCVALKRSPGGIDNDIGLFSGQSRRALVSALMLVETEKEPEGLREIGVIKQLKEKARRVQVLN